MFQDFAQAITLRPIYRNLTLTLDDITKNVKSTSILCLIVEEPPDTEHIRLTIYTDSHILHAMTEIEFYKQLADETRLRCLMLIFMEGELCVCELTHALGLSQPKISRHLANLRQAGVLKDRRDGQWIHYHLHKKLPAWTRQVLMTTFTGLRDAAPYAQDLDNLKSMAGRPGNACAVIAPE